MSTQLIVSGLCIAVFAPLVVLSAWDLVYLVRKDGRQT